MRVDIAPEANGAAHVVGEVGQAYFGPGPDGADIPGDLQKPRRARRSRAQGAAQDQAGRHG